MHPLPPIETLTPATLPTVLSTLFEPTPSLPPLITPRLPYASYESLINDVASVLHTLHASHDPRLLEILGSHPRLGGDVAGREISGGEQRGFADADGEGGAERLRRLNREYEEMFPGLRFVAFVNGRSREVVMEEMEERMRRGDREMEVLGGIEAMRDIAHDRASKLV